MKRILVALAFVVVGYCFSTAQGSSSTAPPPLRLVGIKCQPDAASKILEARLRA